MGPLDNFILSEDALKATQSGFELQFRSHWYRSLPMSCMNIKAKINGKAILENEITVEVNGNKFPFSEVPNLEKEWLFITDAATLHVKNGETLIKGKTYEVEFDLGIFIPYVLVGAEGNPLLASSTVTKTLICQ
ncbi:DUF6379 domain-containing protein [Flavobacterium sp. XS2P12]|uniref:C-glycoside deglycosidase beta subunit domain-containing protein n=1 Tax=Flavobacterium melibiosi TaxID=3398734 RepID=UPI003A8A72D4